MTRWPFLFNTELPKGVVFGLLKLDLNFFHLTVKKFIFNIMKLSVKFMINQISFDKAIKLIYCSISTSNCAIIFLMIGR